MELLRLGHGSAVIRSKLSLPRASGGPSRLRAFQKRSSQAAFALIFSEVSAKALALAGISTESALAALDYDEIMGGGKAVDAASAIGPSDGVDFRVVESVLDFLSDNPAAIVGGVLVLAVPLLASRISGGKKPWGTVPAKEAYEKLAVNDPAFQILDIRESSDIKSEGTPDLRKFRKRVLQISYSADEGFVDKVKKRFKDPANTTLYILDRFDGNSLEVAKLLATNGFKEAYAIKDGAEGTRGWQQSGLPWLLPRKGFSLNLDALKEAMQFETDAIVPVTLGAAAAAAAGVVVFSEAETALQLLGTVALLQIFAKKFLFAEDRKKTLKELQTFLDTKVAPKELVDEIKGVGKALLPKIQEVTGDLEGNGAMTVPVAEVKAPLETAEDIPSEASTKPLSPYIQYPDLKPPSSPTPSAPETVNAQATMVEEKPAKQETTEPEKSEKPAASKPLSPYTQYPDLKPPSSPTPSRP